MSLATSLTNLLLLLSTTIILTSCEDVFNLEPPKEGIWEFHDRYETAPNVAIRFEKVQFHTHDLGYAIGIKRSGGYFDSTKLYWYTGASNGWQVRKSFLYAYNDVFFIDADTGWIVGDNGRIARTDDKGANWYSQHYNYNYDLRSVFFINSNKGWAVGTHGKILHTQDGGNSWTNQNSTVGDQTGRVIEGIRFIDENNGYAAGFCNTTGGCPQGEIILKTTNGGTTWEKISDNIDFSSDPKRTTSSGVALGFTGLTINPITGNIFAYGSKGRILKSNTNGDLTWIRPNVPSSLDNYIYSISFPTQGNHNATYGWMSTRRGQIFQTTNGGSAWTVQYDYDDPASNLVSMPDEITSISMITAEEGWAVGNYGKVFKYSVEMSN